MSFKHMKKILLAKHFIILQSSVKIFSEYLFCACIQMSHTYFKQQESEWKMTGFYFSFRLVIPAVFF